MKLAAIVMFYMTIVLGFIYASVQLFQMDHPAPAWFALIFAFLSIPSIKA